ncbi:17421_t:CDS:1, partial [Funneliformis geosporum]
MNELLHLCKCLFCLENNPNGNLVTKSVYYRYRKRNQILIEEELSNSKKEEKVEEKNININLRNNE